MAITLELDDIQSGVLRPRPTPYAATYVLFRIDDRDGGRALMRRLRSVVASAADTTSRDAWVGVALTYQGLKALGVPQSSLDSFAPEFQQGMAARAQSLGDNGKSSPEHWEKPLGSPDVHVVMTALAAYFVYTGRLRRWHGIVLLILYVGYWILSWTMFGEAPVEMD